LAWSEHPEPEATMKNTLCPRWLARAWRSLVRRRPAPRSCRPRLLALEARLAPAGGITDVQPAGGTVQGGGHTTVTWRSTDTSGFVDVLLSTDGGATFGTTLVSDLPDSGQFGWNVPADLSTSQAEVRVVDHADSSSSATSASPFSISEPTVPIISTVAGNG